MRKNLPNTTFVRPAFTPFLIILFTVFVVTFAGCSNKIRVSEYAKYNRIDHNWYQTFINDSLQFSIDFYGRNNYEPFGSRTKYVIPKSNSAVLKSLGIRNRSKILLYLAAGIKKYGQASYAYLVDTSLLTIDTSIAKFDKTKQGDSFFILNEVFKKGDETSVVAGTKVKNKYVVLVESQLAAALEWWDNDGQKGNTYNQLSTILKGNNTINYLAARKKITKAIDSNFYASNYLKAIYGLKAIPEDTIFHYNLDNFYFQDVVTRTSFFDNLDSIHNSYDKYRSPATTANPTNKFSINGDAINGVCEIAKGQKMLMINESHYDFRHRLFVDLLLDSLYKIGYRNFCVEALEREVPDSFISRRYGFYLAEPFMAGLIRKAKQVGFNVYNYDTFPPSIQAREQGQGRNLYKLYKRDPSHKWLVLAGYNHINKRGFSGELKSALQFFSEFAGFTPYSINQSTLSDITDQRYSVAGSRVGYYVVDTSSFVSRNRHSDLYIINNIKKHPFESPFPSMQPYLNSYMVQNSANINTASYLFVYIQKELKELNDLAVPVYIGKAKNENSLLYLPDNNYVGVVVDTDGNSLKEVTVIKQEINASKAVGIN